MFSAADLILALQRRMLLRSPQRRRPAGEFPPGWQIWFEQMRERVGAITGATSDAIVAEFLQRPLTVPPRRVYLNPLLSRFINADSSSWRSTDAVRSGDTGSRTNVKPLYSACSRAAIATSARKKLSITASGR